MVTFITCVKHPANSLNYSNVWSTLNDTLFSVCSQVDQNFNVIVVCDKKLPLFHHTKLIEKFTEFVEVDIPSHSDQVLNDFDKLSGLEKPFSSPNYWKHFNLRPTFYQKYKNITGHFIHTVLTQLIGIKAANKIVSLRHSFSFFHNQNLHSEAVQKDYFHIANVVLNMASKLTIGILHAKIFDPEYIVLFDADDFIHEQISAFANTHPHEYGWLMTTNYKMDGSKFVPYYSYSSVSGTGNIINFKLLTGLLGDNISVHSSQNELFENTDPHLFLAIGHHVRLREFFNKNKTPLKEFPFIGTIHTVGHYESSQQTRRRIKGSGTKSPLPRFALNTRIQTVTTTIRGNFNIPAHSKSKVVCLGYQKTGTTSIDFLLQDMGYSVAKAYKQADSAFSAAISDGDLSEIKKLSELFDAFQDIPWFLFFKEFDQWYPGSKFILTIRNTNSWWNSFSRYFRTEYYPLFKTIYGFENPIGHEKELRQRYEQHIHDVKEYFRDRPNELLIVDVTSPDTAQKISAFLGKTTSYHHLPHKNAITRTQKQKLILGFRTNFRYIKNINWLSFFKLPTLRLPPIIIGGSPYSGAEYLLSLLSCHPDIHTIKKINLHYPKQHPCMPEFDRFGLNPNPKQKAKAYTIDKKEIMVRLLHDPIPFNTKRWCAIVPLAVLEYGKVISDLGQNVKIINLVRDGRDVVCENGELILAKVAVPPEKWIYDIQAGIRFEDHPQILTVKYEDLLKDTDSTIKTICEFVGIKETNLIMEYPKGAKTTTPTGWTGLWKLPQNSERVDELLRTPGAEECLHHYGYNGETGADGKC